jgi:chromosome segregation ATPase
MTWTEEEIAEMAAHDEQVRQTIERLEKERDDARADRDDYRRRLRATDRAYATVAAERDEALKQRDASDAESERLRAERDRLTGAALDAYQALTAAITADHPTGARPATLAAAAKVAATRIRDHAAEAARMADKLADVHRLAERLDGIETRVHRMFADADVEGVDLNALTVDELTRMVMAAVRNPDGGEKTDG